MTNAAVTINVQAKLDDCELNVSATVPAGPTRLDDLFPLLQILSDKFVTAAEEDAVKHGHKISCCKGCGACCRQLVPVSPVEARHLARLVDQMPGSRREEILGRFAAARHRLEQAGLWEALLQRQDWPRTSGQPIVKDYFYLGIACPFLEDESCSIHHDRPLICREFVVVSPAEHCSNPTSDTVKPLQLAANVWVAAARCEPGADADEYINWVPLIQALEWVREHPEPPPQHSGPELVRRVFESLAGSNEPQPVPATEEHAAVAEYPLEP
jgi:Fe-S-cluster containining protein